MLKKSMFSAIAVLLLVSFGTGQAMASVGGTPPPSQQWSTDGFFGAFDRAQLKRGYQVFQEICSSCHSIRLIYYRNLQEIGFTEDEVKEIAAEFEVPAGPNEDGETHEDGEPIMRKAKPFDKIVNPFANDNAARAANAGALPPDLSLMTKARPGFADYVYALMVGYKDPPEGFKLQEGMSYNEYFPGHQIAMGPPLSDEGVEYADGTKATVDQMARDITAFLIWTAEPELEERKRLGVKVLIFLLVFTAMLYAVKRQVWSDQH